MIDGRGAQRAGSVRTVARVLVADNDPDALELALLDLRLEGHIVAGVPDGQSVFASIDPFAPDVVVLDHRMPPGPTGLQVAQRLRVEHPGLRVLIYSNYQDAELVASAAQVGVAFLPKGHLHTLRAAVAESAR